MTTVNAQNAPWYYKTTGSNHTLLVSSTIPITIGGVQLVEGSYVGVFFDSLGTLACAGYTEYTPSTGNMFISAWGADNGNDGFLSNEEFKWKVWDVLTGNETEMVATYMPYGFPNTNQFSSNGMSGVESLTGNASYSITVDTAICDGESYYAGGANQTTSGTFVDNYTSIFGTDSTVTTNLTVGQIYNETVNAAICDGESYYAGGAYQTTAGTYIDNFSSILGCDSTVTTNLTVSSDFATTANVDICDGESYYAGGADQTTSGTYTDNLSSVDGCDSVVTTNLTVNAVYSYTEDVEICEGELYFAGGANQTTSGVYNDNFTTAEGCDSIITTNLTVHPVYEITENAAICAGSSYYAGGADQTTSGTYVDNFTTVDGCDSIVTTILSVNSEISTDLYVDICEGESHFAGGAAQFTSGTYSDVYTAIGGCDSTVYTHLAVNPVFAIANDVEICDGESYFVGGAEQTTSGTYVDNLTSAEGCDSIVTTNLTVNPTYAIAEDVTICEGETYFAGGAYQTETGVYVDNYTTLDGCDSAITTNLTVNPVFATTENVMIDEGLSHYCGGAYQTVTGTYVDIYQSLDGCDSTVTTNLVVGTPAAPWTYQVTSANHTILVEDNIPITIGGTQIAEGSYIGVFYDSLGSLTCAGYTTYTSSTNDNFISAWGADVGADGFVTGETFQFKVWDVLTGTEAIMTPTYKVNFPNTSQFAANGMSGLESLNGNVIYNTTVDAIICDGESYYAGGAYQTTSGTYVDIYASIYGTDSTITTNLTVGQVYNETVNASICDGESYYAGGAYQTTAGTYVDYYTSIYECDSIVTTNLIINLNYATTVDVEICEGETYFADGANQTSAGTYYDNLLSIYGCDSVVTTNLTVNSVYAFTEDVEICEGESYFAAGANQIETGIYIDSYQTLDGCDSIITTSLLVNPVYDITENAAICAGSSYYAGGADQTTSGTYVDNFTTVDGCDSIVTTILSVNSEISTDLYVDICEGESHFAGGAAQFTSGTYSDVYTAIGGCDSTVYTHLAVNPVFAIANDVEICDGESYFVGGAEQTTSGTYVDNLTSAEGCDSIVTTNLTVNPTYAIAEDVAICEGETYFAGGAYQAETGVYVDNYTTLDGCDSAITTNLTVNPVHSTTENVMIDEGQFHYCGGADQTETGAYFDTYQSIDGCDSIVTTNLVVGTPSPTWTYQNTGSNHTILIEDNIPITIDGIQIAEGSYIGVFYDSLGTLACAGYTSYTSSSNDNFISAWGADLGNDGFVTGETFQFRVWDVLTGNEASMIPTYIQTFPNTSQFAANGMSGLESLNGNVIYNTTVDAIICDGESYYAGGAYQTTSGTYVDIYASIYGTDSTITTNLTVGQVYNETVNASICDGESYYAGGAYQTTAGAYIDYYTSIYDCDSTVTTNLTINSNYVTTVDVEICDGETYFAGGANQSIAGAYIDYLLSIYGCDSVVTTNLTVNPVYAITENVEICEGESYFVGGANQSIAGTYIDNLLSIYGCDSIVTTVLIVNPVYSFTEAFVICDDESYFVGGAYQNLTGVYVDNYQTIDGCDSIITTYLTVNPTYQIFESVSICEGESIFLGGAYQSQPGDYVEVYQSIDGCDSTITTTLNLIPLPTVFDITGDGAYCIGGQGAEIGLSGSEIGVSYEVYVMAANNASIGNAPNSQTLSNQNGTLSQLGSPLTKNNSSQNISFVPIDYVGTGVIVGGTGSAISFGYFSEITSYMIVATNDLYGCGSNMNGIVDVSTISLPVVDLGIDQTICPEASFTIDAGTWDAYLWNDGSMNQTLAASNPGLYSVTITDVNGCEGTDEFELLNFSSPLPNLGSDQIICSGETIVLDPGTFESYNWSTGETTQSISVTTDDIFDVTVTDINGCVAIDEVEILPSLIINLGSDFDIPYGTQATLNVLVSNGSGSYAYSWGPAADVLYLNSQTTQTVPLQSTTTFTVLVTDLVSACEVLGSVTVTVIGNPLSADCNVDDAIICSGDWTQLHGIGLGGSGTYSYQWTSIPYGFSSTMQNPYVSPQVATQYIVAIGDGYTVETCTTLVDVMSAPVAPNAPSGTSPVCAGNLEMFTTSPVATANSYEWEIQPSFAGVVSGNGTEVTVDWATTYAGIAQVRVRATNDCGTGAWSGFATVIITGVPSISSSPTGQMDLCQDSENAFYYTLGALGASSYSWSVVPQNAGTVNDFGQTQIIEIDWDPTFAGTVTIKVKGINNCGEGQYSAEHIVNVHTNPVVNAGQDLTICDDGVASLYGMVSSGTSPFSFNWIGSNILTSNNDINILAAPYANSTYTLEVVDAYGCFGSDEVDVFINSISVDLGDDVSVCNNDAVLTTTISEGVAPFSYLWSNGETTETITVNPNYSTNYTVTVTDAINCSANDDIFVTVPIVDAGALQIMCYGESVMLTGTAYGGAEPYTYSWSPAASLDNPGIFNPTATPTNTTYYTLEVTDNTGCTISDQVLVIVNENPVANAGLDQTIFIGDNANLHGSATGGANPYSYMWNPGNLSGKNQVVTPGVMTTYTVEVTDANGCMGTDDIDIDVSALPTYNIYGQVNYWNSLIGLEDVNATISEGVFADIQTTNIAGSFIQGGLDDGLTYNVDNLNTIQPSGGITVFDIMALIYDNGTTIPSGFLNIDAGDVNNSGTITYDDFQLIAEKSVGMSPAGWLAPDWLFESGSATIAGADENVTLEGICYGDADGSFGTQFSKAVTYTNIPKKGIKQIDSYNSFSIPVIADENLNLRAIEFVCNYPSEFEVSNVQSNIKNGTTGNEILAFNAENGILHIIWANADRINIEKGENLFTLEFVSQLTSNTAFDLALSSNSNFVVDLNNSQNFASVVIPEIETKSNNNSLSQYYLSHNFPNPFNNQTEISYTLPETGLVNLTVYNMLGEKIEVLVNSTQESGTYSIKFDASELASGPYLYKLNVISTEGSFEQSRTMNILK
ncbi:MAG: T9SS type A sorting domain-containing protein [Bacteroidetes bacterium]|nr:T9SS type A sorting domain-containing protein [Bacteroidota bacterium]